MVDNPRLLIVDDEEGLRESFKLILENRYNLIFAKSADEAQSILKTAAAFDLVLLDIKMPRTNGLEFLKTIKTMCPALPVIIVTGYQSVETAQAAIKNGASDYIPKPFDKKDLIAAIERQLKPAK